MTKYIAIFLVGLMVVGCAPKSDAKPDNSYQRANKAYDKAMDELNKN